MKIRTQACRAILLASLFVSSLAHARDTGLQGFAIDTFAPAVDPFGFYSVQSPRNLNSGQFFFQLNQSLTLGSLFPVVVNGTEEDLVRSVWTLNATSSVGITDFLSVGMNLPTYLRARETDLDTSESFTTTSLGDLSLFAKLRLVPEGKIMPGLGLLVSSTVPTGDSGKFLGNGKTTPRADLLIGKSGELFEVAANIGASFPPERTVLGRDFDDRLHYGLAARVPIAFLDPNLFVQGEVTGQMTLQNPSSISSPVGFLAGLKKRFESGWSVDVGAGGGWNNAAGNAPFRGVASVGYDFQVKKSERSREVKTISAPRAVERAEVTEAVYFEVNSTALSSEAQKTISNFVPSIQNARNDSIIRIEGHTDDHGERLLNLQLSRRRAEAVRLKLVQAGISPDRLQALWYGAYAPTQGNETAEGRRLNRRVELRILN